MSSDERSARRARILARGADRLALVKGEIASLPAVAEAAAVPAHARAAADADLLAEALAELPGLEGGVVPPPHAESRAAAAAAALLARLAQPQAPPQPPSAQEPAAAATASSAAVGEMPVGRDGNESVLRQRRAGVSATPPADVGRGRVGARAPSPPSPPAPRPMPAAAPAPRQPAPPAAASTAPTSLIAKARAARRAQFVSTARAAITRALPLLLGVVLATSWWACGNDAVVDARGSAADGGGGYAAGAVGGLPPRLALLQRKAGGGPLSAEVADADGGEPAAAVRAPPVLPLTTAPAATAADGPRRWAQPAWAEALVCRPRGGGGGGGGGWPLVTGATVAARVAVAWFPAAARWARAWSAARPRGALVSAGAPPVAAARTALGAALAAAPLALAAVAGARGVVDDVAAFVFAFVAASVALGRG